MHSTGRVGGARVGYRPELDGVRGIAVLAVLLFHLSFLAGGFGVVGGGGFLGVDVFFVLSGMLITSLLVAEWEATGSVSLSGFYDRRVRRLIPALVVLIAADVAYRQVVDGHGVHVLRQLWSVVTYSTVGHAATPPPTGLSHLWTLVIEWEFYLVWPLVLLLLLRRGMRVEQIGSVAAVLALATAVMRAVLFHHSGGNWIFAYHFAGYRLDELLLGACVGLLNTRPQVAPWLRTGGLVVVLVMVSRVRYPQHWLYLGGMTALALATAAVVQPRTRPWALDAVLTWPPLVALGRISYSLYLWSVPVISQTAARTVGWPLAARVVLSVVLSFGLAVASYELVERRFRKSRRGSPPKALSATHLGV
jgi:peptidoglycan/LPS O-acetylase OafA/YrhL